MVNRRTGVCTYKAHSCTYPLAAVVLVCCPGFNVGFLPHLGGQSCKETTIDEGFYVLMLFIAGDVVSRFLSTRAVFAYYPVVGIVDSTISGAFYVLMLFIAGVVVSRSLSKPSLHHWPWGCSY